MSTNGWCFFFSFLFFCLLGWNEILQPRRFGVRKIPGASKRLEWVTTLLHVSTRFDKKHDIGKGSFFWTLLFTLIYTICVDWAIVGSFAFSMPCYLFTNWTLAFTDDLINNMDKKATWDKFYTENSRKGNFKNFEWFFGFHSVKDYILPLLQSMSDTPSSLHVLDIGCGTSALGPCIYSHCQCAVKVTCADISPVAVRLMQEHIESTPVQPCNPASTLVFREMDCTELEGHFQPKSLALIVDKGTTDALVRSKEGRAKAGEIVRQSLRVLTPLGSLLQFSDEDPDARLLWLENESQSSEVAANVSVLEVGELRGITYFCYQITPNIAQHWHLECYCLMGCYFASCNSISQSKQFLLIVIMPMVPNHDHCMHFAPFAIIWVFVNHTYWKKE